MRSGQEEKPRKMEKKQLISPSRQCSSTPVNFGQAFLLKKYVTTLEHPLYPPDLSPTDFCPFPRPRLKSALKWRLLASLRMWWKSLNGFHKMTSRNVSSTFTVTRKIVYLHKGTSCWSVLCFSDIKLCRKYIKTTTWKSVFSIKFYLMQGNRGRFRRWTLTQASTKISRNKSWK